jgi:hypothetical protein
MHPLRRIPTTTPIRDGVVTRYADRPIALLGVNCRPPPANHRFALGFGKTLNRIPDLTVPDQPCGRLKVAAAAHGGCVLQLDRRGWRAGLFDQEVFMDAGVWGGHFSSINFRQNPAPSVS